MLAGLFVCLLVCLLVCLFSYTKIFKELSLELYACSYINVKRDITSNSLLSEPFLKN